MFAVVSGIMVANILELYYGVLKLPKTQIGDGGKTEELSYYMTGLSTRARLLIKGRQCIERENTIIRVAGAWNQFFASGDLTVCLNDKVLWKI